jgi:hypothetical protein
MIMSPAELWTKKNDYADEDQQQCDRPAHRQRSGVVRQNILMSPARLGTKNYCAGEVQQQFVQQTDTQIARLPSVFFRFFKITKAG